MSPALSPYVKQEFPKWKYHKTQVPLMVNNPAEEKALGAGWYDFPDGRDADIPAPVQAEIDKPTKKEVKPLPVK